jgi:hypothetical protein
VIWPLGLRYTPNNWLSILRFIHETRATLTLRAVHACFKTYPIQHTRIRLAYGTARLGGKISAKRVQFLKTWTVAACSVLMAVSFNVSCGRYIASGKAYSFTVDYNRSAEEAYKAVGFPYADWMSAFWGTRRGKVRLIGQIVPFGKYVARSALRDLDAHGLRAADIQELLAFEEEYSTPTPAVRGETGLVLRDDPYAICALGTLEVHQEGPAAARRELHDAACVAKGINLDGTRLEKCQFEPDETQIHLPSCSCLLVVQK